MKDWPPLPPDEELERADSLLGQADALLQRHRSHDPAALSAAEHDRGEPFIDDFPPIGSSLDDDDIPILTEVVNDIDLPPDWAEATAKPLPPLSATISLTAAFSAPLPAQAAITTEDRVAYQIAERLIDLDTQIARSITEWMDKEFPQFLQRELDRLSEHLQTEMQAHLRATLLPELSARISEQLDLAPDAPPPRSR